MMDMTNIIIGRGNKAISLRDIAKKYRSIVIIDYTEFVAGKSNDGGCYSFWEEYDIETKEMEYGTSSSFAYCPLFGHFCNNDCDECPDRNERRRFELREIMAQIDRIKKARHGRYNQAVYVVWEKVENGVLTVSYENND